MRSPRRILSVLILLALIPMPGSAGRREAVSLALLGDVMLGRGVRAALRQGDSLSQGCAEDWESVLAALSPEISRADLALANLESPLTGAALIPKARFDLRAPPAAAQALFAAGLDLLSLANNHSRDAGEAGLVDTKAALESQALGWIEPDTPIVRTVSGVKLAFLAFSDGPQLLDVDKARQAVLQARESGALPVVSIHWGGEYQVEPDARQRFIAQSLADGGAALIWGHHPHVLQPVEWVQGAGQPARALVAYSLGNALFDQPFPPDAKRSALLLVTLDRSGVVSVEATSFGIDLKKGFVVPAGDKDAEAILKRLGIAVR